MKIGFFTDTYFPSGFGVSTSIKSFKDNLEKMGHKVYIYAPFFPDYKDKDLNVFRFNSIKLIKNPETRLSVPFIPIHYLKQINDIKLDIIHIHTPFSMGFLGKLVSSYQKIPLIYTHHTHYPDYAKFYLKEKKILPKIAKKITLKYSDYSNIVIAPSSKTKKYLINLGVKTNIKILPTGVNLNIFKKSSKIFNNFRKELNIPLDTKIMLFVGRIGKEKNIEFLLKSFQKVLEKNKKPILFLIVGDGPDLIKLKELSKKLKINKSIIFIGQVLYKNISKYYQISDFFIFSSTTETQGIVILEALASGLPVIAFNCDAYSQFIHSEKNGFLINTLSEEMFAKKILLLLNNNLLIKEFSKKAIKISLKFSEEKQSIKLLDIYKNVIKK